MFDAGQADDGYDNIKTAAALQQAHLSQAASVDAHLTGRQQAAAGWTALLRPVQPQALPASLHGRPSNAAAGGQQLAGAQPADQHAEAGCDTARLSMLISEKCSMPWYPLDWHKQAHTNSAICMSILPALLLAVSSQQERSKETSMQKQAASQQASDQQFVCPATRHGSPLCLQQQAQTTAERAAHA